MVTCAPIACKHKVSGSFSLPSRGPFHLSLTVLFAIGHWVVFRLGGWALLLHTGFHVSGTTLVPSVSLQFSSTGVSPSSLCFSKTFRLTVLNHVRWSSTPRDLSLGLASFPFARRYLGNRCFFLFLELLRCFSSLRFLLSDYLFHLRMPVYYYRRVPPFGYLRISGYLLLPAAFRSLSRPSSAPSAKASALCSFSLDLLLAIFPLYCVMLPSFISHIPEYAHSSFSRIPCLKKKSLRSFMLSFRLLALTTF